MTASPIDKYRGDPKAAAADVHPDHRTRKQHLAIIAAKRRIEGESAATVYWLTHCPRISKAAYQNA